MLQIEHILNHVRLDLEMSPWNLIYFNYNPGQHSSNSRQHMFGRVPTAQGTREIGPKKSLWGKHREFGNFAETLGKHREFGLLKLQVT